MAFCTKISGHLKQGCFLNRNVPVTSTLSSLRYMSTKLFVGGLSPGTDEQSLKDAFSSFNGVTESRVMTNKVTGKSRGYGFLNFISEDSAKPAISAMDGQELNGFNIHVNVAKDWPSLPLSLDENTEDEKKGKNMVSRSVWKDPFVDAFLMKKKNAAFTKKIWSRRSTILPEYLDSFVDAFVVDYEFVDHKVPTLFWNLSYQISLIIEEQETRTYSKIMRTDWKTMD